MIDLAVVAAALWGSGNFAMGLAVRRSSPRASVVVGFAAGLVAALVFFAVQRPEILGIAFLWGLSAGMAQGLGWLAFARSLSRARVSVGAPVAATTTTVVLYAASIVAGKAPSALALVGVVVALGAIRLFSAEPVEVSPLGASDRSGVAYALIAGSFFALQALALVKAGTHASALVMIGTALGVLALLLSTALFRPFPFSEVRAAGPRAIAGGLAIFVGDVAYLYALRRGAPTLTSVVAQMHPVLTAVLATIVLRERPRRSQLVGIALAVVAVVLIGTG